MYLITYDSCYRAWFSISRSISTISTSSDEGMKKNSDALMHILFLLFALDISNQIPLYVIVGVLLSNWHRLEFFPSKQTDERSETRTSGCSRVVCSTSFKLIPQNRHGCWLCKAINIYNRSKVVFLYAWNTDMKLRIKKKYFNNQIKLKTVKDRRI